MPGFLYQLPKNIARCFKGYNLLWHFLAIVLTCIIVISDFDWYWFSEFVAGAIIGSLIGAVVGKSFKHRGNEGLGPISGAS